MIPVTLLLVALGSLFMAYRRHKNNERGFAYAWMGCAAINIFCLIQYLTAN